MNPSRFLRYCIQQKSEFPDFLIFFILIIFPFCTQAQILNTPAIFRVTGEGKEFQLIVTQDNVTIFLSDRGEISLSVSGEAQVVYSEMLGPDYGKIRKVGVHQVDYYLDTRRAGKLSKIGSTELDYFEPYLTESWAGKLKSIGGMDIGYYSEIDGIQKSGRIATIKGIPVDYYYGGDYAGKILRIGMIYFYYYPNLPGDIRAGKIARIEGKDTGVIIETMLE